MEIKTADGEQIDRVFGLVAGKAGVGKNNSTYYIPKKKKH